VIAFVSLLAVSVIAVAANGSTASRSTIAIHEHGTNPVAQGSAGMRGTFTIDLAGAKSGPSGTTYSYPDPSPTRYVDGEAQTPFVGTDTLTSKQGHIELAVIGTHIDVNNKLLSSGSVVGPAAEYGTWTIKTATGIYRRWRGGGNWASVTYGYGDVEPYSVEWDGYVTR
jgi:hypothetical protein